jgi:polyisoprenyl-teichoic acid--peptidoglycan teichoic acid transferase
MTSARSPTSDPGRARRRRSRLLQLLGLLVASVGLAGHWLDRDAPRTELHEFQRELLGVDEGARVTSFVLAGRDRVYFEGLSTPVYGADGSIVGWDYAGPRGLDGNLTDSILYVSVVGDVVTLIAIPRDLYLDAWGRRINSVYAVGGADGLRRAVEVVLGLPVDYYVIIDLDVFENVVDALGGVEVNVPYRMLYADRAAGLRIDLRPGLQLLDGAAAAGFVRFRQTPRGDLDRLDNVKSLAFAMLRRVRDLNVRAVALLPELLDVFFADVETNASPALARELLPRLPRLELRSATLPTYEQEGSSAAFYDRREIEAFLAATYGGVGRAWVDAPAATVHVVDRSGREGTGAAYVARLVAMGVPEERLLLTEASRDSAPSRMVVTAPHWSDADYYASLLGVGKQQIDRLAAVAGHDVGMQLVLGGDARAPVPGRPAFADVDPAAWARQGSGWAP